MDELSKIRKKIDGIDGKIAVLLKKRLQEIQKIRKIKAKAEIPIEDQKREEAILRTLETEFERKIFGKILEESRKAQKQALT